MPARLAKLLPNQLSNQLDDRSVNARIVINLCMFFFYLNGGNPDESIPFDGSTNEAQNLPRYPRKSFSKPLNVVLHKQHSAINAVHK